MFFALMINNRFSMKHILIFLFILFSINAICQTEFLTKKGSTYFYKGQEYKYTELEPLYAQHLPALELYNYSFYLKKRSRNSFLASGGLIAFGTGLILIGAEGPTGRSPYDDPSFAAYTILGGIIAVGIGAFQRLLSWRKLDKARTAYNFYLIEQNGYDSQMHLELTQTSNGIGFVLNF